MGGSSIGTCRAYRTIGGSPGGGGWRMANVYVWLLAVFMYQGAMWPSSRGGGGSMLVDGGGGPEDRQHHVRHRRSGGGDGEEPAVGCTPPGLDSAAGRTQVMVYARQNTSDWRHWPWDKMAAIVAIDYHDNDLLRHAREHSVKYGLLVTHLDFPLFGETMPYDSWVKGVAQVMANQGRDVIHFDLEKIFKDTGVSDPHARVDFVRDFIAAIRREIPKAEIAAVYSWTTPCDYKQRCNYLNSLLDIMDYMVLVTQGYHGYSQSATSTDYTSSQPCAATPRAPYARVVAGIEGMISCGVRSDQIVPLISWEGSMHNCDTYRPQADVCVMADCDDVGRVMDLAAIVGIRRTVRAQRVWNATYSSPYFTYFDAATSRWRQVWYEDVQSLGLKYDLVELLQLRGVGIWQPGSLLANGPQHEEDRRHIEALEREMWHLIGPPDCPQLLDKQSKPAWKGLSVSLGPAMGLVIAGFLLGSVSIGSLLHYKYRQRHVLHASCDDEVPALPAEAH